MFMATSTKNASKQAYQNITGTTEVQHYELFKWTRSFIQLMRKIQTLSLFLLSELRRFPSSSSYSRIFIDINCIAIVNKILFSIIWAIDYYRFAVGGRNRFLILARLRLPFGIINVHYTLCTVIGRKRNSSVSSSIVWIVLNVLALSSYRFETHSK